MKYSILLTLAAVSTAFAQPDLRILLGDEPFDIPVPGLISEGPWGSFGGWEYPIDESACFNLGWLENFHGIHKFIWMNLTVINVGDAPFNAGNAWDNPRDFIDAPMCVLMPVLADFYAVTLTTPEGGVVLDRILSADFWWDAAPFVPGSPKRVGYWDAGISPGWFAWAPSAYLDISSITNGNYNMTVTLDPLNLWDQFSQETIAISVDGFDVRVRQDTPQLEEQPSEGEEVTPVSEDAVPVEGEADAEPEVKAEPAPEVEAETAPEVEAETVPEVEAETAPEVEAETVPEVEAETAPEVEVEVPAPSGAGGDLEG